MKKRNPESYLALANQLEQNQGQGRLKIYLGAAPGVGKTYEMLNDALNLRAHGMDVVIGAIVTHGRKEVESLAAGFEKLALLPIDFADHRYFCLDLDGIIRRAPALVLVDEAALSNPQGAKHAKRWQDIFELIERGIDVYTTLNVQHLESLNDVVTQFIGVPILETVPDFFIERANTLELVDLPSQELILRLKQGKVYLPEDVAQAKAHYFQQHKLDVLRELALRVAAQKLDLSMEHVSALAPEGAILVVLQGFDCMPELFRLAKQLSTWYRCCWYLLYTINPHELNSQSQAELLRLAASLDAKTRLINGKNLSKEVKDFIDHHHIRLWIVPHFPSRWWQPLHALARLAQDIDNLGVYRFPVKTNIKPRTFLDYFFSPRWFDNQDLILDFLQDILPLQHQSEILKQAYAFITTHFKISGKIYLHNQVKVYQFLPLLIEQALDKKEEGIIQWVFHCGKAAGPGSTYLTNAKCRYFPIQSQRECLAVLAFDAAIHLREKQIQNLQVCLHYLALILERERSCEVTRTEVFAQFQNRLRDQLLSGLAQQLNHPLRELINLLPKELEGHSCKPLIQRLSSHLQVMSYFNHPQLSQEMSEQSMEAIIQSVLQKNNDIWQHRPVHWFVEPNLPKVWGHFELLVVLVENLLDNIDQHANAKDGIDISLHQYRDGILVQFADLGPGFAPNETNKIFDYFYAPSSREGLGLGLALCERIIAWHGGQIWAENRRPHGAIFNFTLPRYEKMNSSTSALP